MEANDNIPDDEMDLAAEITDAYNDPELDDLTIDEFAELLDDIVDVFATD